MARLAPGESSGIGRLLDEISTLAGKRSDLLVAEARLWTEAAQLLANAAEDARSTSNSPAPATSNEGARKQLLSVGEAAEYLNLSRATLDKWRIQGGGPEFARIGGRIFYRRSILEQFIAGNTYPHTSAYRRKT